MIARDIERRGLPGHAELRASVAGRLLRGFIPYGSRSEDLGGFVEQIAPGAFSDSLAAGDDVLARAEQDSRLLLGRRSSGTLRLWTDSAGLNYEVDLPDTTAGRDSGALVRRGDVCGSSFAFIVERVQDEDWDELVNGTPLRTLKRVRLVDVAPVAQGAYAKATVSARVLSRLRTLLPAPDPKMEGILLQLGMGL